LKVLRSNLRAAAEDVFQERLWAWLLRSVSAPSALCQMGGDDGFIFIGEKALRWLRRHMERERLEAFNDLQQHFRFANRVAWASIQRYLDTACHHAIRPDN
jgi:hypothetical protein